MKKLTWIVLLLLFTTYSISFAEDLSLSGEGAILIDWDTGQVLYEKNSHMKLQPASTTKIMTGILAIENGNMNDMVIIDDEIVALTDGSHIALEPGERIKLEDLLNGLLIQSANDAALAIAKHISGNIDDFVKLMNTKAQEIGASNTNFVNPNGLTADNHLTTAHDLALMARYAMENNKFREIVNNYTYTIPITNKKDEVRYLKSHNRLLYSTIKINVDGKIVPIKYEGANGIKTGYTMAAQNCLVASAERGGQRFIAVVLKANGREVFADIHKLLNYGFNHFEKVNIANKDQFIDNIKVNKSTHPIVAGILKNDLCVSIPKESNNKIDKKIYIDNNIEAPVEKGETLGKVEYYLEGELLGQVDIISTLDIKRKNPIENLNRFLKIRYLLLLIGFIIIKILINIKSKKRRRRRVSTYRKQEPLK